MSTVSISYRQEDAAGHAGRLHDRLAQRFGSGSVFMDVQDIRSGADFRKTIEQAVASCEVLVVVIGPRWLTACKIAPGAKTTWLRRNSSRALR